MLFVYVNNCVDVNSLEKIDPDTINSMRTYEEKKAYSSWWKAGISEYSITEEIQNQGIIRPLMELPDADNSSDNMNKTEGYQSETFTVYDLNTKSYVTSDAMDLVLRIVRNEIGAHYTSGSRYGETVYAKEAVKAYAVAAYTHIKYCNLKGQIPNVGLRSDYSEQMKNYVQEVDGQGIYYNDDLICAMYCASTGGYTISGYNGLGTDYPYLSSVESRYDDQGKQYFSQVTMTADELRQIIESKTDIVLSDEVENWIKVDSVVDGNYVGQMIIDGHTSCNIRGKQYTLNGSNFKQRIMNSYLKSPAFTVDYADGTFTFNVYGYGHGLGLPADGANLYANIEGWDYKQILEHYFQGTIVK